MKKSIIRLTCLILLLLIVGSTLISCSEYQIKSLKFSIFNRREFMFDKTAEEIIALFGTPARTFHCPCSISGEHVLDENGNCVNTDPNKIFTMVYDLGNIRDLFGDAIAASRIWIEFDEVTGKAYSIREYVVT